MEKLTQQEIEEYVEAFKCFDLDENGHLCTKELKYAMRMLGLNPTDMEVQELVNGLDYDELQDMSKNETGGETWKKNDFPIYEGTIDFKEFVNVMENYRSLRQDDEAAMFFKVFDSENRGFIEGKAIKRSLQFLDDVPINEINEILTKTNLTDDKKIFIEEFAANFLSPLILKDDEWL
ncbi:hypothetical protein ACROYT_G043389 [Oculina patagonica]